jgi:hypothetical protein
MELVCVSLSQRPAESAETGLVRRSINMIAASHNFVSHRFDPRLFWSAQIGIARGTKRTVRRDCKCEGRFVTHSDAESTILACAARITQL